MGTKKSVGNSAKSANLSVELPRTPQAAFLARRALDDLHGSVDPDVLPDVRLLVSELITNSVKYGGEGPVRLEIQASDKSVRAEIIDQGVGFTPKVRDSDLDRVGGWGLHLTERLTSRWGTYEGSTHVWFEIDLG
ncbi:MAG: serine/threonine-protein kinase RsbW [Thermoleophilaceae bacterium]|nr:serine/threonine-protein kinase RsbW [Thermoleophilaceae bacterium]